MKQLMAAIALEDAIATYSTTKNESGTIVSHAKSPTASKF
jgi:hypothetical protein